MINIRKTKMCIYQIMRIETGEKYIGQTVKEVGIRWDRHSNPNNECHKLRNAINKYGKDAFDFSIIEVCENINQLNEREEYWINELKTLDPNGYNLQQGGSNKLRSEASKLKSSISAKNRIYAKLTPEQRLIKQARGKEQTMKKFQRPDILEIIKSETTVRGCTKKIVGYVGTCHHATFLQFVEENGIDISHFEKYGRDTREAKFHHPDFLNIVKTSNFVSDCFKKIGHGGGGSSNRDFWNFVIKNKIDTSHFAKRRRTVANDSL